MMVVKYSIGKSFLAMFLVTLFVLVAAINAYAAPFGHKRFDAPLGEVDFRKATVESAARVLSDLSGANIIVTKEAGGREFDLYLTNTSVKSAIDSLCRINNLWYRYNTETDVFVIMTNDEYRKELVVFRDQITKIFTLKYQNVVHIAKTIAALYGDKVNLTLETKTSDSLQLEGLDEFEGQSKLLETDEDETTNNRNVGQRSGRSLRGLGGIDDEIRTLDGSIPLTTSQLADITAQGIKSANIISSDILAKVGKQGSASIHVTVNRMHNLLYVRTGDSNAMREISRIIAESDRPSPQVLLEMKVLSVDVTDRFKSAFDFTIVPNDTATRGPPDSQQTNPLLGIVGASPQSIIGTGSPLSSSSLDSDSTLVFQLMNNHIRARIQMLQENGDIEVLATPVLLAANNRASRIFIGEEVPITTGFSGGTTIIGSNGSNSVTSSLKAQTEVKRIGNTLMILPSINADRTVVLRLMHDNSSVKFNGATIPIVNGSSFSNVPIDIVQTSTFEGIATAADGMTIAVGGMFTETRQDTETKVPVLGDLPILGNLFKKVEDSVQKQELILLITPHVFTTPEEAEARTRGRLGELSRHPNSIDVYFNKKDDYQQRSKHSAVENVNKIQKVAAKIGAYDLDSELMDLTHFAAESIQLSHERRPKTPEGVFPVRLGQYFSPVALFKDKNIEAYPVKSWHKGQLYVTAVSLQNKGDESIDLSAPAVSGDWLSVTLASNRLEARGKAGSSTHIFLISEMPFITASEQNARRKDRYLSGEGKAVFDAKTPNALGRVFSVRTRSPKDGEPDVWLKLHRIRPVGELDDAVQNSNPVTPSAMEQKQPNQRKAGVSNVSGSVNTMPRKNSVTKEAAGSKARKPAVTRNSESECSYDDILPCPW